MKIFGWLRLPRKPLAKEEVKPTQATPVWTHGASLEANEEAPAIDTKEASASRRKVKIVRKTLYERECVDLCDAKTFRPNRIARNAMYEEEMVYVINGKLFRSQLRLDNPFVSLSIYSVGEPFFVVIHRQKLTDEERFVLDFTFSRCPYFLGIVKKKSDSEYEMVRLRGISA